MHRHLLFIFLFLILGSITTFSQGRSKLPSTDTDSAATVCPQSDPNANISVDPREYSGWYGFYSTENGKFHCSGERSIYLPSGQYALLIGNSTEGIAININKGQVSCVTDCSESLVLSKNKITFKTAKVTFDPRKIDSNFYLSSYLESDIFNRPWNSFKDRRSEYFVPGYVYFVSVGGKGYGQDISFKVNCDAVSISPCEGRFSDIGLSHAATTSRSRRVMCFTPLSLKVTSLDFSGRIKIDETSFNIKERGSFYFDVLKSIPHTIMVSGMDNTEKVFFVNDLPYEDEWAVPELVQLRKACDTNRKKIKIRDNGRAEYCLPDMCYAHFKLTATYAQDQGDCAD